MNLTPCLCVLASAVAFTAGAEIRIVSSEVQLNERLARAEAKVKVEGWTKDAPARRLRLCVERDARSTPVTHDGEYFLATPLRDIPGYKAGKERLKPSVTLVDDSMRHYDEGPSALDRARLHFTEPNGPAKSAADYVKDPNYGFPIHKYPIYTGKPEWVMPVGAGELSAMVSWGVNDLHINLSKTDYYLLTESRAAAAHKTGHSLCSPGHVTVYFDDLRPGDLLSFDQAMDVKNGRLVFTLKCKQGVLTLELFGDRESGALIVDCHDARSKRTESVRVVYSSEHRRLSGSAMHYAGAGRIQFFEDNDTDYPHVNRLRDYYATELALLNGNPGCDVEAQTNRLSVAMKITPVGPGAKPKDWAFVIASVKGRECSEVKSAVRAKTAALAAKGVPALKAARDAWWKNYWSESYIAATGDERAALIERLWYEQLYVWASVGYGKVPPKFNGGAGLVLGDSRSWGAGLWMQNTREELWPLGAANHREYLENFVRYYEGCRGNFEAKWLAQNRGVGGFKIAETITSADSPLFVPSTNAPMNDLSRPYTLPSDETRAAWRQYRAKHMGMEQILSSGTEMLQQMCDYVRYYGDESFVPAVGAWLRDQTELYLAVVEKGGDGKWHVYDTYENESWTCPEDCHVDLCAARFCFGMTARLGAKFGFPANLIALAKERYENLADLPTAGKFEMTHYNVEQKISAVEPGDKLYLPFRNPKIGTPKSNVENNELYAVYPFTMGDYGKNVATFRQGSDMIVYGWEPVGAGWGWYPVPMWAARLALPDAADFVYKFAVGNNTWPFGGGRSPASIMYSGAEVEDCPYLDSAGVLQAATQELFLQSHAEEPSAELFTGGPIRLLPAVPKTWSGAFKLRARGGFLVECAFEKGEVKSCTILSTRGGELKYLDPSTGKLIKRDTRPGECYTLH